jgi:hypothetical protein
VALIAAVAGCGVGGSSDDIADAVHDAAESGRPFRLADDVITLLVFVRDGEVVKAYDQGNGDGFFHCLGKRGLSPEEAVFRVKRVDEGEFNLDYVLRPPPRPAGCPP